jgi:hypothetical protein
VLFPRARLLAIVFLLIWVPSYTAVWGWRNFFQLCDVTVFLTVLGLWRGSALLLSSQAVGSLVVNLLWALDAGARLVSGHHLVGGTEYMWNAAFPLAVRLLSLFHLALPALHIWALRRTGYDPRGFRFEIVVVALVFVASRVIALPNTNPNFVFVAPLLGHALGPAPVHVALVIATQVAVMMLPAHLLLRRHLPTVGQAVGG